MIYTYYSSRYNNNYTILDIEDNTNIYIVSNDIDYYIMDNNLVISYNKGNGITITNYRDNINSVYINDKALFDVLEEYRYFGDRIVY